MLPIHENNQTIYRLGKQGLGPLHSIDNIKTSQQLEKFASDDSLLQILDSETRELTTKLLIAAECGDENGVSAIVHQGILLERCVGMGGYTPLHHASNRGHVEIVRLLLECNSPVDQMNSDGETALHLASFNGNADIVELLLENGANINAQNKDQESALFYACRRGSCRTVRILLRRGINRNIKNGYGDVAMDEISNKKLLNEFKTSFVEGSDCPLGREQLLHIFSWLDARALENASGVCDRWHTAAEEPNLWKDLGVVSRAEGLLSSIIGLGFNSPMSGYKYTRPTASTTKGRSGSDRKNRITSAKQDGPQRASVFAWAKKQNCKIE